MAIFFIRRHEAHQVAFVIVILAGSLLRSAQVHQIQSLNFHQPPAITFHGEAKFRGNLFLRR